MSAFRAFGIVSSADNSIHVEGLHDYRPIGAFSFLGRFRVIDFPISNMSNSGMDRIQVYLRTRPRSIAEHIGSGRHYNINSKRGKVQMLFSEDNNGRVSVTCDEGLGKGDIFAGEGDNGKKKSSSATFSIKVADIDIENSEDFNIVFQTEIGETVFHYKWVEGND